MQKQISITSLITSLLLSLTLLVTVHNNAAEQPTKRQKKEHPNPDQLIGLMHAVALRAPRQHEAHSVLQALNVPAALANLIIRYDQLMFMDVHRITDKAPVAQGKLSVTAVLSQKGFAQNSAQDKYTCRIKRIPCRWVVVDVKEYCYPFHLQIEPFDTLDDIQAKISDCGIPAEKQNLFLAGNRVTTIADLSDALSSSKTMAVHEKQEN